MDAGLSRWLLALGNRTPPREPTPHRFATTNALLNSKLRRDSTRSRFAPSIRLGQVERPRAGRAPVAPPPSRLSRCLLRSSQFQRPTASRIRAGTPAPPGRLPGAGGKHRAARAASSPPMRTKPVVLQRPARAPGPLRSGGGRQGARQPRKNKVSGMLMDAGLSRSLLFGRRPATSLRTKTKSVEWTPPGCRCVWAFQRHAARHLPLHFFYFFQGKGDERNKKKYSGRFGGIGSCWWAVGGSVFSVALPGSISCASRRPWRSGLRWAVPVSFVLVSRGGSRWSSRGCVSPVGCGSRSPAAPPRPTATPPPVASASPPWRRGAPHARPRTRFTKATPALPSPHPHAYIAAHESPWQNLRRSSNRRLGGEPRHLLPIARRRALARSRHNPDLRSCARLCRPRGHSSLRQDPPDPDAPPSQHQASSLTFDNRQFALRGPPPPGGGGPLRARNHDHRKRFVRAPPCHFARDNLPRTPTPASNLLYLFLRVSRSGACGPPGAAGPAGCAP